MNVDVSCIGVGAVVNDEEVNLTGLFEVVTPEPEASTFAILVKSAIFVTEWLDVIGVAST